MLWFSSIKLLALSLLSLPTALADVEAHFRSGKYAHGFEGAVPLQQYTSEPLLGLIPNYQQHSTGCDDGLFTILAPRGSHIHHPGPMILDDQGHLVWYKEYGTTYNANIYKYKGESYITFWAGNDTIFGHGSGKMYMLNSHYEEKYVIAGTNGLSADFHEFHITHDGTALFPSYGIESIDLRAVNQSEAGWIWDGKFQEVDIETNELLFEWSASDHFSVNDVERGPEGNGDHPSEPWDYVHINSIDKDDRGNFLVSLRYTNCIAYIDGTTGDVLWRLGGRNSSFLDLSDGAATNISWQHHARFQPDYNDENVTRAISIFDNSSRGQGAPQNPSRGLLIDINEKNMTASVRRQYWSSSPISSQSQGSVQIMDNGHVILGYGYNPAWAEFSFEGELLCEAHFGPSDGFGSGQIESYRVFKQPWIGRPLTLPSVALSGSTAYVSWNGATEVATWVLEGTSYGPEKSSNETPNSSINEDSVFITAVPKSGFETKILIPSDTPYRTLRVAAFDKEGEFINATGSLEWSPENMEGEIAVYKNGQGKSLHSASFITTPAAFGLGLITAAVLLLCAWFVNRVIRTKMGENLLNLIRGKNDDTWQTIYYDQELDDLDNLVPEQRDNEALLQSN